MVGDGEWTFEHDNLAGYDCMSCGFWVCRGGDVQFVIDCGDRGHHVAEKLAEHVVAACNRK